MENLLTVKGPRRFTGGPTSALRHAGETLRRDHEARARGTSTRDEHEITIRAELREKSRKDTHNTHTSVHAAGRSAHATTSSVPARAWVAKVEVPRNLVAIYKPSVSRQWSWLHMAAEYRAMTPHQQRSRCHQLRSLLQTTALPTELWEPQKRSRQ